VPNIDRDVVDRADRAGHQLDLGVRRVLEMHPAQRPGLVGVRDVALDDTRVQAARLELFPSPGPSKEPTLVRDAFWRNQDDILNVCG
jgi:hypothetical protein